MSLSFNNWFKSLASVTGKRGPIYLWCSSTGLKINLSPFSFLHGGNVLTLQKVLGHASLVMTMRYAHLAPDYLKEAMVLGPIRGSTLIRH